jgi:hypothetical protein
METVILIVAAVGLLVAVQAALVVCWSLFVNPKGDKR